MKYNPKLGIMGNIKLLFSERNQQGRDIFNNKAEAERNLEKATLQMQADFVESVIDEYKAITGEEE